MAYPKIVARKIRMCMRFGHLPEAEKSRHVLRAWTTYYCRRCGENVPRAKRGAA